MRFFERGFEVFCFLGGLYVFGGNLNIYKIREVGLKVMLFKAYQILYVLNRAPKRIT